LLGGRGLGEDHLGVGAEGIHGQQAGERIGARAIGDAGFEARDPAIGLGQCALQLVIVPPQEHARVIGLMQAGIEPLDT
jgi:hypothetical protein